jgi:hypothetical protein
MRKPAFDPCIPTRGTKVPDRLEWFHEIKHVHITSMPLKAELLMKRKPCSGRRPDPQC